MLSISISCRIVMTIFNNLKQIFLSFTLLISTSIFASDNNWLLTNISLVDVETGKTTKNSSIWINDGKIKAINPTHIPKTIKKVSGDGRWVIPGLSEMHAHVPGNPEYTDRILTLFITHGITNIRGMLGQKSHLNLRKQLNSNQKLGPYLVTSGPSINGNSVQSPKQAIKTITEQVKAGYDFHKIHPGLSKGSYQAVSQTASNLNSSWGGHISSDVGVIDSIKAGQATIDHLDGFMETMAANKNGKLPKQDFFGLFASIQVDAKDVTKLVKPIANYPFAVVPTETLMHNFVGDIKPITDNPAHQWMPQNIVNGWKSSRANFWNSDAVTQERAKHYLKMRALLINEFQQQGVPILLGSDAPQVFNVPGDSTHRELELMVNSGLSPLQALQTGTLNVNQFYAGKHPVGKIEKGLRADLVLLNDNPLLNISNTRKIYAVVVAGKLLNRNKLDGMLKMLEE